MKSEDILLGLDVGEARIGVAIVRMDVRIPHTLITLPFQPNVFEDIAEVQRLHDVTGYVVGWPRDMEGRSTEQTRLVEDFAKELRKATNLPVYLQDEALTSRKAEAELRERNKPYEKGEVDALAAVYILEDYIASLEIGGGNV